MEPKLAEKVRRLLDQQKRGFSLSQEMYTDSDVFEAEMQGFLGRHWMIGGHVSRIPNKGDFFLREIAGATLVFSRFGPGPEDVAVFHNVCRHRGARVCEAAEGNQRNFTCRYHSWSYRLDGSLQAWRHMPDDLDKGDFGLKPCGVQVYLGIIFYTLDPENAPDFQKMVAHVTDRWARYDIANCKLVRRESYDLQANWKLGIENNLECYHCLPCHPEYTAANAFVRADENVSDRAKSDYADFQNAWDKEMEQRGVPTAFSEFVATDHQLVRMGTWGIGPGVQTGSRNGTPLAPLLGSIKEYDGSVSSGCFGALCYLLAYNDYVVISSYTPLGPERTMIEFNWLVRADAVEGQDYNRDDLSFLWDVTTRQDKDIIELNAQGVRSRGYMPGPYSKLEWLTGDFLDRYREMMTSAAEGA